MEKPTDELVHELMHSKDIDAFHETNREEFLTPSLSDYLNQLLIEKDMTKAEIIQGCGLQNIYVYQIFSGIRRPSRDKLLALAVGFRLNVEETQRLLNRNGYQPLYIRNQRDAYLLHCFKKHYTIDELNLFLEQKHQQQLFYVE